MSFLSLYDMLEAFDIHYEGFSLPTLLSPTRIYRKGARAYWAGTLQDAFLHWPHIADFRAIDGQKLYISPQTEDQGVLKLFTESEATGLVRLQQGYFLLHASCVCLNGQAVIFAGTPGAGKSTTTAAFVKAGYAPLADDMVVVHIDNEGVPWVMPSGRHIKIWHTTSEGLGFATHDLTPCFEGHNKYFYTFRGEYPTQPIPLAQICLLHRSNRWRNDKSVAASQVPFQLLKHFPLPHQLLRGAYLQKHFVQSLNIARHVKMERLQRPKDFAALENWVTDFTANFPNETFF